MHYGARYYSPLTGRFLSADTIVPGTADGSGGGAATIGYDKNTRLTPLTVDFHEFIAQIGEENQLVEKYGPFFKWDDEVRKEHPVPMGPTNPQALNRYSYTMNNPLKYVDPTGHEIFTLISDEVKALRNYLYWSAEALREQKFVTEAFAAGMTITAAGLAFAPEPFASKGGAAVSGIIAAISGFKGIVVDEYALWELDVAVELLDLALENADPQTGMITLEIKHEDIFGFTAVLRCYPSCGKEIVLRDWYVGGRLRETANIWDYLWKNGDLQP